jgi:RNA ligase (TIGR02306 family)
MANSTHKVEVFRVEHLEKHPNADTLNIMRVFDNYQAVVRIADYKVGDLACYVPPDNILPDKPEYAFLKGRLRIKATKLRGAVSQGLVLPAPAGSIEGDDVAEMLGITHYVPKVGSSHGSGGGGFSGAVDVDPPFCGQKYDIDSWFRYGSYFEDGLEVEITEKIHGTNTRASFQNGKFWMGSRNHYRKADANGMYWKVLHRNPWLKRLCKQNPDCIVYGETFGWVHDLKYGATESDTLYFRVFDILTPKGFMNYAEKVKAMDRAMQPTFWQKVLQKVLSPFKSAVVDKWQDHYVPILYVGPYSKQIVLDLMGGETTIPNANHVREGVVIKPLVEQWDRRIGRLILKAVSPEYLERAA